MSTRVLPMTTADLDEVMAIEVVAYSHPWTRGNFIDSLVAGYLAWRLVDDAGRCIGYCVAMAGVEETHLLNLTVAPSRQGRGHGRALLSALCADCTARGDQMLWLEVRQSNDGARRLYARFGFAEVGLRRDYYPAGSGRREHAVVMSLSLVGRVHALD
ncbi:ribosomal protein S18-alanine N-acetyltransferase [Ideonella sp. A 288]|uniref:ribosomal protein S18-alanine N-acetyltransferase n=1 Tax=Ideonella sp. A 288 TaxID=1962181 RepID=UPI000B4A8594|nr:ribosomal protein S18-alanine N-acetyltransferase [Ideonella sp. A 288]